MSVSVTATVQASARRLFPDMNMEQVLARLLLERAQKNLIKYRTLARQFEVKYGLNTVVAPHQHDTGVEGRRPVDLSGFLDEVEGVLAAKGLP